mgnify:CR=1 FL=1|jgi:hypothetical protein
MSKHHLIISGTGRSGTTFLMQLLTHLGYDTGFKNPKDGVYESCNAGMERDLRDSNAPYIVKSPYISCYLRELLEKQQLVIDFALVPIRDIHSAAKSRINVSQRSAHDLSLGLIPGGIWLSNSYSVSDQEHSLTKVFYELLYTLTTFDIPLILLDFPRIITDHEYLYLKLKNVFPDMENQKFKVSFAAISNPQLVHNFQNT